MNPADDFWAMAAMIMEWKAAAEHFGGREHIQAKWLISSFRDDPCAYRLDASVRSPHRNETYVTIPRLEIRRDIVGGPLAAAQKVECFLSDLVSFRNQMRPCMAKGCSRMPVVLRGHDMTRCEVCSEKCRQEQIQVERERKIFSSMAKGKKVYFLAGGDRIKIGHTANLEKRFRGIRTCSPIDLQLLAVVAGDGSTESELHILFKKHRSHGEWFEGQPVREWLVANNLIPDVAHEGKTITYSKRTMRDPLTDLKEVG
jgi:hypothetical protein